MSGVVPRRARITSRASESDGGDPNAVSLSWAGRRWRSEGGQPRVPPPPDASAARTSIRTAEIVRGEGEAQRLIHGDGLVVLGALAEEGLRGKVDLVYVDPPYASDRDYVAEARLDGPADGRAHRTMAYEDRWSKQRGGLAAYLEMLAPRLDALVELLSARGTIWVHLDWRAAYLVRVILDEVLGRDAFINEIVWRRAPNLGRQAASGQFGRTLDTIVVYGKKDAVIRPPSRLEPIDPPSIRRDDAGRPFTTAPRGDYTDASIAKLEAEGRVHRTSTGRVYIKYFLVENGEGVLCRERRVDALWTDVAPLRHAVSSERTGYPTQKPRSLLERIITCATEPGALVVDAFAGSGTTAVAAHALGRRAILVDRSPVAIATARARLLREKAPLRVDELDAPEPPAPPKVDVVIENGFVRLVAPKEPLAWAVGTETDGVFHTAWHSERVPGAKPRAATLEAPYAATDKVPSVRVYGDDGSIGTWAGPSTRGDDAKKNEPRAARRTATEKPEGVAT